MSVRPTLESLTTLGRPLSASGRDIARRGARQLAMSTSASRALPDFLIVGTKRGGTTSLWNYLLAHPLVMPMFPLRNQKSAHYFDVNFGRGDRWYRSHFPSRAARQRLQRAHGHAPVAGEASPLYMWDPRVAPRVAEVVPQAKIIVLLRNPVDRAYSHWKERVGEGVEPLSFEAAIDREPERLAGEVERMMAEPYYVSQPFDWFPYVRRGEYLPQVRRWFEHFDRSQVLVLRSEDMYADPEAVYHRTISFLDLPAHTPSGFRRFNYTPSPDLDAGTRHQLEQHYRPLNDELAAELGPEFTWASNPS